MPPDQVIAIYMKHFGPEAGAKPVNNIAIEYHYFCNLCGLAAYDNPNLKECPLCGSSFERT
jgi:rubrerythrin